MSTWKFYEKYFFLFKAASGKWPDDVAAINHVKAAFCLKIAKQLSEKCQLKSRGNVDSVEVINGSYTCLYHTPTIINENCSFFQMVSCSVSNYW